MDFSTSHPHLHAALIRAGVAATDGDRRGTLDAARGALSAYGYSEFEIDIMLARDAQRRQREAVSPVAVEDLAKMRADLVAEGLTPDRADRAVAMAMGIAAALDLRPSNAGNTKPEPEGN